VAVQARHAGRVRVPDDAVSRTDRPAGGADGRAVDESAGDYGRLT